MVTRLFPDLPHPDEPLTEQEKRVFGHDARRHPICGFVLEQPLDPDGRLTPDYQAELFCQNLERTHGPEAAAMMRRRLSIARK
jgi:hypothetical protein